MDEEALKALVRAAVALNTSVRAAARTRPLSEETKERLRTTSWSSSTARPSRPFPGRPCDQTQRELNDWRGETLARLRTLIKQADLEVVEEWKWRGVPVWSHAGIICTGETYKNVVKPVGRISEA
jgi:hypothetical protein